MHIFISYAKKDTRPLATRLFDTLNSIPGLSAWMDSSLEPVNSWEMQIQDEIKRCDLMIVMLSPDVNRSQTPIQQRSFVRREIDYARSKHTPIMTVIAQMTEVPLALAGDEYIDLTQNYEAGFLRLINHLCKEAGVESPTQRQRREAQEQAKHLNDEKERLRKAQVPQLRRVQPTQPQTSPPPISLPTYRPSDVPIQPTVSRRLSPVMIGGLIAAVVLIIVVISVILANREGETPETAFSQTLTAQMAIVPPATATLLPASDTPAPTDEPTSAPTATMQPSETPTPTITLSPTPSIMPTFAPGDLNSAWTPRIETFDGVQMAYVPAGCFMMGSSDAEIDYAVSLGAEREWLDDETPQHQVCLDAFWIDVYEVTNAQFAQFNGQAANASFSTEANRPREQITWFEASDFCAARDAQLPSEAEWEYAARGPEGLIFPWGNTFVAENVVSGDNQTADVGSRPGGISWVGAYDLSGNVLEWVSTIYDQDNYSYPYDATDGREDLQRTDVLRVVRGGSWYYDDSYLRSAVRFRDAPTDVNDYVGFRCARSS